MPIYHLFAYKKLISIWRANTLRFAGLIFCLLLSNYALANSALCAALAFAKLETSQTKEVKSPNGVSVIYSVDYNGKTIIKQALANHLTAHKAALDLSLRELANELGITDFKDTADLEDYFTNIIVWSAGEYKASDGKFLFLNETSGAFGDTKHDTDVTYVSIAGLRVANPPRTFTQQNFVELFARVNPHLYANFVFIPFVKDAETNNRLDPAIEQLKFIRHEFVNILSTIITYSKSLVGLLKSKGDLYYYEALIDEVIKAAEITKSSPESEKDYSKISDFFSAEELVSVRTLQSYANKFIAINERLQKDEAQVSNNFSALRVAEFLISQDNFNLDSTAILASEINEAAKALELIIEKYRKPGAIIQNI